MSTNIHMSRTIKEVNRNEIRWNEEGPTAGHEWVRKGWMKARLFAIRQLHPTGRSSSAKDNAMQKLNAANKQIHTQSRTSSTNCAHLDRTNALWTRRLLHQALAQSQSRRNCEWDTAKSKEYQLLSSLALPLPVRCRVGWLPQRKESRRELQRKQCKVIHWFPATGQQR